MTREKLIEHHKKISLESRLLMAKKNHDYSKLGAFDNFKLCEKVGICTAAEGVLVRMCDKISRLATLMKKPGKVSDESMRDTIIDVVNYAIILDALNVGSEAK
jgi:hypothetical protein